VSTTIINGVMTYNTSWESNTASTTDINGVMTYAGVLPFTSTAEVDIIGDILWERVSDPDPVWTDV
jgi:hypothetical protein